MKTKEEKFVLGYSCSPACSAHKMIFGRFGCSWGFKPDDEFGRCTRRIEWQFLGNGLIGGYCQDKLIEGRHVQDPDFAMAYSLTDPLAEPEKLRDIKKTFELHIELYRLRHMGDFNSRSDEYRYYLYNPQKWQGR